jgi:hypothetical protein
VALRGIEDRHVKLGCLMPGETPEVFGEARRLAAAATYLYQDGKLPHLKFEGHGFEKE